MKATGRKGESERKQGEVERMVMNDRERSRDEIGRTEVKEKSTNVEVVKQKRMTNDEEKVEE